MCGVKVGYASICHLHRFIAGQGDTSEGVFPTNATPVVSRRVPTVQFSSNQALYRHHNHHGNKYPNGSGLCLVIFVQGCLGVVLYRVFFREGHPSRFLYLQVGDYGCYSRVTFPSLSGVYLTAWAPLTST